LLKDNHQGRAIRMSFINFTTQQRYREELVSLLSEHQLTHWVTLNTNTDCSIRQAMRLLQRWRVELLRRLHGRRFYFVPLNQRLRYLGTMELTQAGFPHFHLLAQVPEPHTAKFLRLAGERWQAASARASSHIVPIEQDPGAPQRLIDYATKRLSLGSEQPFVHSEVDR